MKYLYILELNDIKIIWNINYLLNYDVGRDISFQKFKAYKIYDSSNSIRLEFLNLVAIASIIWGLFTGIAYIMIWILFSDAQCSIPT